MALTKIFEEKIGVLSQSAGTINLSASKIVIGNQSIYTSGLSRVIASDVTLVANTLYMIYAVISGGVPVLRISTNFNSVGPAGFSSWKLVGAFYSDGSATPVFGSFVNIVGTPSTGLIGWIPTFTGAGTVSAVDFKYRVKGGSIYGVCAFITGGAGPITASLPNNAIIDPLGISSSNYQTIGGGSITTAGSYFLTVLAKGGLSTIALGVAGPTMSGNSPTYSTWAIGERFQFTFEIPVQGWSNTQLIDL